MQHIAGSLQWAVRILSDHSDSPRLDAELLLGKVLGLSRVGLTLRADDVIDVDKQETYAALVDRRARGAPVAYLTGTREFWSLNLAITPDVLVPRPETELLVAHALALLPENRACSVLDLGTGSGAIALAIASDRPQARITAVDWSEDALAVAMRNARALGMQNIDWRRGSWFDAVPGMRYEMVVANPPYVSSNDPALAVLAAEPALALTPGPTGLEALITIVAEAPAHLIPNGWLLLEHGSTQAAEVRHLLRRRGFDEIRTFVDHADLPRVTVATLISTREESS